MKTSRQSNRSRSLKQGVVALEFLFAAPAFFILVFFVVELALLWSDRHIMRLAAYRAARSIVKTRAELSPEGTKSLCWVEAQGGSMDADSEKVKLRARRAASKVMALITPSISQLMPSFGSAIGQDIDSGLTSAFQKGLNSVLSTAESSDYSRPLLRMLRGIPSAWLLTGLECQDIQFENGGKEGIELTVVYLRSPRMPFIGTVMWVLYWLNRELQGNPNTPQLMAPIDELTYGISLTNKDPMYMAFLASRATKALTSLQDALEKKLGEGIDKVLQEAPPPVTTPIFSGQELAQATVGLGAEIIKSYEGEILLRTQGLINFTADQLGSLILAVPDAMRLIPVKVSVRVPNYNQVVWNEDAEWAGDTTFLGKLGDKGTTVGKLSHALGKAVDDFVRTVDLGVP